MPSLQTCQSNITKNYQTLCRFYCRFNCRQTRLDSCTCPYSVLSIFVALCLHKRSRNFYKSKRQPFQFHNLNSMVPVKGGGGILVQFCFLSHLFFLFIFLLENVNILAWCFLIFFIDCKPLMNPKGESA